jgi:hypothetical protein
MSDQMVYADDVVNVTQFIRRLEEVERQLQANRDIVRQVNALEAKVVELTKIIKEGYFPA